MASSAHTRPLSDIEIRVKALESLLVEKGLVDPAAVDAIWLSLWTAGIAAAVNAVVGTAIAWTLVRWDVPGRRLIAALVDLPLAIPTLVADIWRRHSISIVPASLQSSRPDFRN
jgi:ABC-type sulfate transport system permease subunit